MEAETVFEMDDNFEELAKIIVIGGGGGGRPNIAQAGGKNPAGVQAALAKAAEALAEELR